MIFLLQNNFNYEKIFCNTFCSISISSSNSYMLLGSNKKIIAVKQTVVKNTKPEVGFFYRYFYWHISSVEFFKRDLGIPITKDVNHEINRYFSFVFWFSLMVPLVITFVVTIAAYGNSTVELDEKYYVLILDEAGFTIGLFILGIFLGNLCLLAYVLCGLVSMLISQIIFYNVIIKKILPKLKAIELKNKLLKEAHRRYNLIKTQSIWNQ